VTPVRQEKTGQKNLETGAFAWLRFHVNMPAMFPHDPKHRREAEAGPLTLLLRGVERLEQVTLDFLRHPAPRIGDR
jgi:hypothetical protein